MRIRSTVTILGHIVFTAQISAQGLLIDTSFGDAGISRMNQPTSCNALYPYHVSTTENGDLLSLDWRPGQPGNPAVVLFRTNSDGILDGTFGGIGYFTTDIPELSLRPVSADELPDGRILMVLTGSVSNTQGKIVIMRLTAEGVLDPSFGTAGKVVHTLDSPPLGYTSALQPDGKLVMTGTTYTGIHTFRFLPDGSPDLSFGTNGDVTAQPSPEVSIYPRHVALDGSGNIFIGGGKITNWGPSGWAICGLDPNGHVLNSFGTNGFVVFDHIPDVDGAMSTNYESIERLYADGAGNIYAAGAVAIQPVKERMALAKFNATGALDPGFGTGGILYATPNANDRAWVDDLVADPSGTLVISGHNQSSVEQPHLLLLRMDMAGTILGSPENGGVLLYNDPAGNVTALSKVTLDNTGRIILASGYVNQPIGKAALTAFSVESTTDITQATIGTTEDLRVFPNPASSEITVTYDLHRVGMITLELVDATGRSVERLAERNAASAGRYVEHLAIPSKLASGHYRLVLNSNASLSSVNLELVH